MAKFTTSILSGSYQLVMILFCSNIFSTKTPNSRSFLLILFKRRIYHPIIQRKAFKIISFDVQITKKKRRRKRTRNIENSIFIIIIITFIFSRNLPASCVFPTTKTEKNPHVSSTIDTYQKNNTIFLTTDVHFWNNKNKLHSIERIENDRSSGIYQM